MSSFPDFHLYDGVGLAELIRKRQVTSLELVEESISRIEKHNSSLNAVINKLYDQARIEAKSELPDGTFKGVPFLLKDLLGMVKGVPTSGGNRLLSKFPAEHDSELVRRWKAAGVVILGKTNTPEFGLTPYTEPEFFGPTLNPWDLTRTPGGSSGGSGAAVAARFVPMASGGDGGGSIRIPASCCGLFGLKPSRGRTPTGPDSGEFWHGFAQEHVITRSVRDSAAMLDATAGTDPGAPYIIPAQLRSYLEEVTTPPGKLRIAYTTRPMLGKNIHTDCVKGVEETVKLLGNLGHQMTEDSPVIDGEAFSLAFFTVIAAEIRADIEEAAARAGRKPSISDFDVTTFGVGLFGNVLTAADYASAVRTLQSAARKVGEFFQRYDVLLTPTLAEPPVKIGALAPTASEQTLIKTLSRLNAGWVLDLMGTIKPIAAQTYGFVPWTPVFNVTGQPAMSMPLYWNEAGLPIGMHFVGRFGDEATLFRLAGQLEQAKPWFDRAPQGY